MKIEHEDIVPSPIISSLWASGRSSSSSGPKSSIRTFSADPELVANAEEEAGAEAGTAPAVEKTRGGGADGTSETGMDGPRMEGNGNGTGKESRPGRGSASATTGTSTDSGGAAGMVGKASVSAAGAGATFMRGPSS